MMAGFKVQTVDEKDKITLRRVTKAHKTKELQTKSKPSLSISLQELSSVFENTKPVGQSQARSRRRRLCCCCCCCCCCLLLFAAACCCCCTRIHRSKILPLFARSITRIATRSAASPLTIQLPSLTPRITFAPSPPEATSPSSSPSSPLLSSPSHHG